jgi:hypothetical protein
MHMKIGTSLTTHQKAVNALLETAFSAFLAFDAERSVPRSEVPGLLRAAIDEQRGNRGKNQYAMETTILEHALMLLEQAPDENCTPEQEVFFAALNWELDRKKTFRVRYEPQNVTVN